MVSRYSPNGKNTIEEDAAEDDWPNLGAGETWPGSRRRVKGVKLGLSRYSCCLVLLPHSAPSPPSKLTYPHTDPSVLLGDPRPPWNGGRNSVRHRKEE